MDNKQLKKVVNLFKNSDKITVFTGAGISTNCGIPDFRGPEGLYTFVQEKYNLPYPEAIFDIDFFHRNPAPFYQLSKELFTEEIKPSVTHQFVAWLEEQNKISLVMTQNIDMLHTIAGNKKVIECHGGYQTAHCTKCEKKYSFKDIEQSMRKGKVPYCTCEGVIKPDVVFFGEQLPFEFYKAYQSPPETDLLVVMGSSLTVQPAAGFALNIAKDTASILINLDRIDYEYMFTYTIHEDLDKFSKLIWDELRSEG